MSAKKPLVTVLVPTYNRASYLKETIDSVLNQNFTDFELLVLDNCSTDTTKEVVAQYKDSRIHYTCNEVNIGITGNYNKGLSLAKGDYIYMMSDDDLMSDARNLGMKVAVLEEYPAISLVHSNVKTINGRGEVTGGNWAENHPSWSIISTTSIMKAEQAFEILNTQWCFLNMHTVMVRKSTLDKYNLTFNNQLRYLLDWGLWMHLALVSDMYYIDEQLVSYRVHENNTTKIITDETYYIELMAIKIGIASLFHHIFPFVETDIKAIEKSVKLQLRIDNSSWIIKKARRAKSLLRKLSRA